MGDGASAPWAMYNEPLQLVECGSAQMEDSFTSSGSRSGSVADGRASLLEPLQLPERAIRVKDGIDALQHIDPDRPIARSDRNRLGTSRLVGS